MTKTQKTVHIKTYGCQMNVYDSDRMTDVLTAAGYREAQSPETADLVILNTCHIREKAAEKVYSELGRIRQMRDERRSQGEDMTIAVAGCVAQAEGAEIIRRAKHVDLVVGPQSYADLPALVARAQERGGVVETEFSAEDKFLRLPAPRRERIASRGPSAFLSVQEGCDKFCTFCVVPYTRGAEMSRPASHILAEARALIEAGALEITLVGQNVNAYHGDGPDGSSWSLARLLRALAEADGSIRLRYTTSHPRDMHDDLFAAHADLPQLMPFLHLPVQSGSDRILKRMNRKHSGAEYMLLVDRIRAARPDIALSSDFIVGFPGETDAEFEETLRLAERVGYAQAFSFKYSPRPGTPAADMDDQIEAAVQSERLARLHAVLAISQTAFNEATVGRDLDVLLDRDSKKPGHLVGRTPYLQPVQVEAPPTLKGRVARMRIESATPNVLFGRLAS